ncbi:MAG: hypothetical protein ACRENI_15550 [Gemmatimonadaceae bacterium]
MTRSAGERTTGMDEQVRYVRARARNVIRRPLFVLAVGGAVFVAALIGLLLVPRRANRASQALRTAVADRPDTVEIRETITGMRGALAAAESSLTRTRAANARASAPVRVQQPTLSPESMARRDSLGAELAELDELLTRAASVPLPATYRAVGSARALRGDSLAVVLLDSLSVIEQERAAFDAAGGVGPIFVGLTMRAAGIGREITARAESARTGLREEIDVLRPPPASVVAPSLPATDTMPLVTRRDGAVAGLRASLVRLEQARSRLAQVDLQEEEARRLANVAAPPVAMLAAAIVMGLIAGFVVALLGELRFPRISDAAEVEQLAGARVLSVVRPQPPSPERMRRSSDRVLHPLIRTSSEDYRLLYHHLASAQAPVPLVTVTGAESGIVAAVACNLAVLAAQEARNTLLVDADPRTSAVATVMQVRAGPGLVDVLDGRVEWAEAIVPALAGRDRTVFVVPAGLPAHRAEASSAAANLWSGLARMTRRYDAVIAAVPLSRRGDASAPIDFDRAMDVVVCAGIARMSLEALVSAVNQIRESGGNVRGIVLWRPEPPHITIQEIDGKESEMATPAMS